MIDWRISHSDEDGPREQDTRVMQGLTDMFEMSSQDRRSQRFEWSISNIDRTPFHFSNALGAAPMLAFMD